MTALTDMCTATPRAASEYQNLPYDKHGSVDWRELDRRQLRRYTTVDLKAELDRRSASE